MMAHSVSNAQFSNAHGRAGLLLVCGLAFIFSAVTAKAEDRTVSLAGQWRFIRGGPRLADHPSDLPQLNFADTIDLPGTTDTNRKGNPSGDRSSYSLTQPWQFTGICWYERDISIPNAWAAKTVTLLLERTKYTQVWLDGHSIGDNVICCTPQEYQLGEKLTAGTHKLTIAVDNTRLPPSGADAHQFSGNTQGNWNGIIGRIEMRMNDRLSIEEAQVDPDAEHRKIRVKLKLMNASSHTGDVALSLMVAGEGVSAAAETSLHLTLIPGVNHSEMELTLGPNAALWDEFHPALHHLTITLEGSGSEDAKSVTFGLRNFTAAGQQFAINGQPVFLRGRHDACVFPLTGHPPMDVDGWLAYFKICQSYGLNHVRFHTWTPPEAAFEAADQMGFYLQPELPFWGAFTREVADKLQPEAERILAVYGNHPSFVMFSMGNEHWDGRDVLASMVAHLRSIDSRHLYVRGSNAFFYEGRPGIGDDYLISGGIKNELNGPLLKIRGSNGGKPEDQGHVQTGPANTLTDYSSCIERTRWPTVTHEMGQYTSFPDSAQIEKYTGVSRAYNIEHIRQRLAEAGMSDQAGDFARASGALAGLCYREEIESCLRTPHFGGFELLDLQDYPGQGTALVGILDSLMQSKGIFTSEQWRQFCAPVVLLARFQKYTWTQGETFNASIELAQYGPRDLRGQRVAWALKNTFGKTASSGILPAVDAMHATVTQIGSLLIPLENLAATGQFRLELSLVNSAIKTDYNLWVYESKSKLSPTPSVKIVRTFDAATANLLAAGDRLLLVCDSHRALISTVGGGFASDFWNFTFFHNKPGTLGLLCDPKSAALSAFPTEDHSDWQWFYLAMNSQPLILDNLLPKGEKPIVQVIDNYERCHKVGLIFELKVGKGKLLVCASDLLDLSTEHPEARQLLSSLLAYAGSDKFNPHLSVSSDSLIDLFRTCIPMNGCKVTASSYDHGWQGYSVEQVIDGNDAKGWKAAEKQAGPVWFEIEFPKPTDLNGGEILWDESSRGSKYVVEYSTDGKDWEVGCDRRDKSTADTLHRFTLKATGVRFVRVSITATPGNRAAGINEIRFYPVDSEENPMNTIQTLVPPQNPILPDFQADPTARVFNGKLYIYPSHDLAGNTGWDMVDWHVFSTDDMHTFTDQGVIFSLKDITWAHKYAWAPDCIERGGKYYFYFPADFQIGVAVSDSPTGPFKDALGRPLIPRDQSGLAAIDPCVFIDDDGQAYLYFGNSNDHVGVVKLKSDMITLDGPVQVLDLPHYHEGIWVHKRKGLYYFSYPSYKGDKIANLMEYSIAKSPLGPFDYKGVILDNHSRNVHGSITEFKNQWYLFYHVAGPSPYERRVCVEPLSYNDDGTIKPMQMTGR